MGIEACEAEKRLVLSGPCRELNWGKRPGGEAQSVQSTIRAVEPAQGSAPEAEIRSAAVPFHAQRLEQSCARVSVQGGIEVLRAGQARWMSSRTVLLLLLLLLLWWLDDGTSKQRRASGPGRSCASFCTPLTWRCLCFVRAGGAAT